jgi:hypothetical protein
MNAGALSAFDTGSVHFVAYQEASTFPERADAPGVRGCLGRTFIADNL